MKKYRLLKDETKTRNGHTLYRIQALRKISTVNAGDKGGFVESERNLSHAGTCWLFNDSCAYENAVVMDHAKMYDNAVACRSATLRDNATAFGGALITDFAEMKRYAVVADVIMRDRSVVSDGVLIYGDIVLKDDTVIDGDVYITKKEEWWQDD